MPSGAAQALSRLMTEAGSERCHISRALPEVKYMSNGIKYYSVEVTSESGIQYGISAFDEEAQELFVEAKSYAKLASPMLVTAT